MDKTGIRLKQLRKKLGITQTQLAEILGVGKTAVSNIETLTTPLSERNIRILVERLNVNREWLKTGRGDILSDIPDIEKILRKASNQQAPMQGIPLYSLSAMSPLSKILSNNKPEPDTYLHLPNLPKCDGALIASGRSMSPIVESGDIILFRKIRLESITYGDMYLLSYTIDGEEETSIRYILKSDREGYIRLSTRNSTYPDKDLETQRLLSIASIKANIRISSMR